MDNIMIKISSGGTPMKMGFMGNMTTHYRYNGMLRDKNTSSTISVGVLHNIINEQEQYTD